jgi:hypothetical protein
VGAKAPLAVNNVSALALYHSRSITRLSIHLA